MAYARASLARQGGVALSAGNTKGHWLYASADTLATIAASGYFNDATARLKKGDRIDVLAALGGTPVTASLIVTSATGAATVTTANGVTAGVSGVAADYKIARGVHTQVAASDTVVTGLATVVAVVASFHSAPTVKQLFCAADIGDQAGTPAAGSILIKTFKPTAVDNATPTAATDFSENLKLDWIAVGT